MCMRGYKASCHFRGVNWSAYRVSRRFCVARRALPGDSVCEYIARVRPAWSSTCTSSQAPHVSDIPSSTVNLVFLANTYSHFTLLRLLSRFAALAYRR